jgi:hypothetical protein
MARIDIAAHGEHRRDAAQLVEYLRAPDIAGMNDRGAAAQRRHRLRPQHSMGVGDDADVLHGGFSPAVVAGPVPAHLSYACTRYVGWAKALFAPCPRGRDVPHHVGTAERRPSQIRNASAAFAHPTDLFRYACTSRRRPSTGPKRSKSATAALSSCALALPRIGAVRSRALAATSSALMGLPGVPRTS